MNAEQQGLEERDRYLPYAVLGVVFVALANILFPIPGPAFIVLIAVPAAFVVAGLAKNKSYLTLTVFIVVSFGYVASHFSFPGWVEVLQFAVSVVLVIWYLMKVRRGEQIR